MLREANAPLIRREDYAAPPFWIREVDLSFDLDGAKTIVASKLRIERNAAQPAQALRLHGVDLTLLRVMADGQSVSFRHEPDGALVIDNPPAGDSFTLEIRNTCVPDKNTQLSGLYTSGSGLFTQCEAQGLRRLRGIALDAQLAGDDGLGTIEVEAEIDFANPERRRRIVFAANQGGVSFAQHGRSPERSVVAAGPWRRCC